MNRFERNIAVEGIGEEGQEKLRNAKVLVIGAGGLGCPVLLYLAAAGVGTLGIVDHDTVSLSNLQRQVLHAPSDIGRLKTDSAQEKLKCLYPDVRSFTYPYAFTEENAAQLIREYDFIMDCCDSFDIKFLINDICVREGKPFSHAAVVSLRGEVMTWLPGHADYRAVFGGPPEEGSVPSPAEEGVLGSMAGTVGTLQATEAIKYLTGTGELILDRIMLLDGRNMRFHFLKIQPSGKS